MSESQPVVDSQANTEARRGDAVLVVLQTNSDRTFTIHRMNEAAELLLEFEPGEMIGRHFETILSPKTAEILADDVEFEDDAPDLGDVLSKYREIRLRKSSGQEIAFACKVTRLMSQGTSACFQLVLPDQKEALSRQKIKDFIALNLEGRKQIDAAVSLPNRDTAAEFLPLLENYLPEIGMQACFAIIRMDRFKKSIARYGQTGCTQLLQHMANCCLSTFRSEDIVFTLTPETLGVVLFDISRESSRLVFNRLRWNIRNHFIEFGGKSTFSVTTTIIFDMLDAAQTTPILERAEKATNDVDADERNGLVELGQ